LVLRTELEAILDTFSFCKEKKTVKKTDSRKNEMSYLVIFVS